MQDLRHLLPCALPTALPLSYRRLMSLPYSTRIYPSARPNSVAFTIASSLAPSFCFMTRPVPTLGPRIALLI